MLTLAMRISYGGKRRMTSKTSALRVLEQLAEKCDKLVQAEQKISDVRTLRDALIKEGVLEERTKRESVHFDYERGVAYVDTPYSYAGLPAKISRILRNLSDYCQCVMKLTINTETPHEGDTVFSQGKEVAEKLKGLGFTVFYDEDSLVGVFTIARHGNATAKIVAILDLEEDC